MLSANMCEYLTSREYLVIVLTLYSCPDTGVTAQHYFNFKGQNLMYKQGHNMLIILSAKVSLKKNLLPAITDICYFCFTCIHISFFLIQFKFVIVLKSV